MKVGRPAGPSEFPHFHGAFAEYYYLRPGGALFAVPDALSDELDPQEDQQATPSMRRHLAKVLLVRCVSTLLSRPDLCAGDPA